MRKVAPSHQFRAISLVLITTIVFLPFSVNAQTYPKPIDRYVNDYAQIITDRDEQEVKALLSRLEKNTGIQSKVVTIKAIENYRTRDRTIESFATNLFNTWQIGNRRENDGILFLVSVSDRKVRIELGRGFGTDYNGRMTEIIQEYIVPNFKNKNYSLGIKSGASAIVNTFDRSTAGSIPQTIVPVQTAPTIQEDNSSNLGLLGIGVGVLGGITIGGVVALRGAHRNRKRECPKCKTTMVRLEESADNLFLDAGQNVEEQIRSVDYDVWKCPRCSTTEKHRYDQWSSNFSQCPSCNYKTLEVSQRTIRQADYHYEGEAVKNLVCRHCSYENQEIIILPILHDNSSSDNYSSNSNSYDSSSYESSSSDSGGSSDGGGSSGDW